MKDKNPLAERACEACRTGSPRVEGDNLQQQLKQLPDWSPVEVEGVTRLERRFEFPDFSAALDFTVKVGELAEDANHHPLLMTEWGRVTVHWWTHKIKGLHMNDFILAARCDALY